MPNDDETEHHGGGQSGYGSGRLGGDRTMGPAFRNQESGNHSNDDRQGVRTDERGEPDGNDGQPAVGYTRADDRIKESVGEALEADHIDATHIEVVVRNGEVFLTGLVEDPRQNRLAEDLIGQLPGVKGVQNELRLRGNPNTDRAVGQVETETSPPDTKHRA